MILVVNKDKKMSTLSNDLTWALMGRANAHTLRNRNSRIILSKEKGNIAAIPARKYSTSLTNSVGMVNDGKGNAKLLISTKKAGTKPSKGFHEVQLNSFGKGSVKTGKTVSKLLVEQHRRPDISRAALAHLSASVKAGQRRARGVAYTPKPRRK